MIHFILCGHGSYGSSLKESLEMLLPEVSQVSVIDFKQDMDITHLTKMIQLKLDELSDQPAIIFCDMLGGAPFKTCSIETLNRKNKVVVAGVNLTAILEVYFQREDDLSHVVNRAIDVSKESLDYFPKN